MSFIKELIEDNKYILKNYGAQQLIIIWVKLIGYLVITPTINIILLWKVWIIGILFAPITYIAYVIALQGQKGVTELSLKLLTLKNNVYGWFKK